MTSPDVRKQNFNHLHDRFFSGTDAKAGLKALVEGKRRHSLSTLLRSHRVKSVTGKEVSTRDSVDQLLSYFSLLEIAAMVGALSWPLPGDFGRQAKQVLSDPDVRRYYEKFYPLILPVLFRWRLEGEPLTPLDAFADSSAQFLQFLSVSELLDDPGVKQFLWFLDSGRVWDSTSKTEVGLGDFFRVLLRPQELVKRLANPKDRSPSSQAVRGFSRFVFFGQELDQLLISAAKWPKLQSAFWHYHAYWFHQLAGQVSGVLAAAVEVFREYVGDEDEAPGADTGSVVAETHTMMDRAQLVLQRLTSSVYRVVIEQAYFDRTLGTPRVVSVVTDVFPSPAASPLRIDELESR